MRFGGLARSKMATRKAAIIKMEGRMSGNWGTWAPLNAAVEDRTEILRRRIAAYRCYLTVGGDIHTVRLVLNDIAMHEAELAAIAHSNGKPEEDSAHSGAALARDGSLPRRNAI
jgi:hypothetical protein